MAQVENYLLEENMVNYLDEKNRRDLGIVWLIAGLIFLFSGFSGGAILLLLGFVWLYTTNGQGQILFRDKPDNMSIFLKRTTIALLILTAVILIANAIP
jgi:hypothetical protein